MTLFSLSFLSAFPAHLSHSLELTHSQQLSLLFLSCLQPSSHPVLTALSTLPWSRDSHRYCCFWASDSLWVFQHCHKAQMARGGPMDAQPWPGFEPLFQSHLIYLPSHEISKETHSLCLVYIYISILAGSHSRMAWALSGCSSSHIVQHALSHSESTQAIKVAGSGWDRKTASKLYLEHLYLPTSSGSSSFFRSFLALQITEYKLMWRNHNLISHKPGMYTGSPCFTQ